MLGEIRLQLSNTNTVLLDTLGVGIIDSDGVILGLGVTETLGVAGTTHDEQLSPTEIISSKNKFVLELSLSLI